MKKRAFCTVCNHPYLSEEAVVITKPLPLSQACVDTPKEADVSAQQHWVSCPKCGSVQLLFVAPDEIVYGHGHAESFGQVWENHHSQLAQFIKENKAEGDILEIGGGNGKLAKKYREQTNADFWINIDPASHNVDQSIEKYMQINGLFDENTSIGATKTIVMSHCLEHVGNMFNVLQSVHDKLPFGGRLILSWPTLDYWLQNSVAGGLNWEHTFFCPMYRVARILESIGFNHLRHKFYLAQHSLFLVFEKSKHVIPANLALPEYCEESSRNLVKRYFNGFEIKTKKLLEVIDKSQPVWFMPASIYTQFLYCMDSELAELAGGIIDDSPTKQGKRLYGTSLKVIPLQDLTNVKQGQIILNGGAHSTTIINKISTLNSNLKVFNVSEL